MWLELIPCKNSVQNYECFCPKTHEFKNTLIEGDQDGRGVACGTRLLPQTHLHIERFAQNIY